MRCRIEGNFDDCQGMVKDMFNNHAFRDGVSLSGVNSINWARIMAQIVYYFSSALSLGAPDRPVSFTVPTGNFGDIFAGYAAKRMGLPIDRLVIATNDNDILARTLDKRRISHARASSPRPRRRWTSRSRRISNACCSKRPAAMRRRSRRYMAGLKQSGGFTIDAPALARDPGRIRRRPGDG